MKLINCQTLSLEEFYFSDDKDSNSLPSYGILSHRWVEEEEVSYLELRDGKNKQKKGWKKIISFCTEVYRAGYQYGWIDTCCIDKLSSSELSEAVNSMYRWYRRSERCYVYLEDFSLTSDVSGTYLSERDSKRFQQSEWFKRGWTLQELLTPTTCEFYDSKWRHIGSRKDLSRFIEEATGIPRKYLTHRSKFTNASIARRMCWASNRKCSREEDRAYSLLGIFQVSMPPIYGEGAQHAFLRLQRKIISTSDDESIFTWQTNGQRAARTSGMLALDPSDFASCGAISAMGATYREAYESTNKGLRIKVQMEYTDMFIITPAGQKHLISLCYLNCETPEKRNGYPLLGVLLAPHSYKNLYDRRIHKYFRLGPLFLVKSSETTREAEIYIEQLPSWFNFSTQIEQLLRNLCRPPQRRVGHTAMEKAVHRFRDRAIPYNIVI